MKICPECGFVFEKNNAGKAWVDFEFTEDNYFAFRLILEKTLVFLRLHELSKMDAVEREAVSNKFQSGVLVPIDLTAKFESFRMGINISLCAILEYFHNRKTAPKDCVRIKDTKVFCRYENIRHLSAHVIADKELYEKYLPALHELDIQDSFTQIAYELLVFIMAGIEKYLELGNLSIGDLKNSEEAKHFLELINERRQGNGMILFGFQE